MKKILFPGICLLICHIFSFAQTAPEYQWGNVAIGAGGFVSALIPSTTEEGLMYARTDVGGAYRWDDSNQKWVALNDWVNQDQTGLLGIEALALDPQASNKVYMLAGISYFNNGKTAILKSEDYGETFSVIDVTSQFKAHGNGMGRQNGERLVVDPNMSNILFCGTRWNGLFKSSNYGDTWTKVNGLNVSTTPNENGICFVIIDESSATTGNPSKDIYVGVSRTGTNLYKSTDGGQTFNPVTGGPENYMPQRAKFDGNGNLIITYGNGAGPHGHWALPEPMDAGGVWKYSISGNTWTNITPNNFNRAYGGVSVDPGNPQRIIVSTINTYYSQNNTWGDQFFISNNGGNTWTDIMSNGMTMDPNGCTWVEGHSIHWAGSMEFNPYNSSEVWVTSGNGVFVCANPESNPNVWTFKPQGLEETVPLDIVSIPNGPMVSVIGDYDGFIHNDVRSYSPIHNPQMGTSTGIAFAGNNPNKLLRVGNDMYYSNNQGSSWTKCNAQGQKGRVAVSANGDIFLHCPESSSTTYRSTNNGSTWSPVNGLSISDAVPVADPINNTKFYAFNNSSGVLYISTDGGANFSPAGNAGNSNSRIIRTVPNYEGHLWLPLYWNGLSRSTNSGQSFTKINGVSNCEAVGLGKAAPGSSYPTIYIWGTVNNVEGVFRSTDEGDTWTRINDNAHQYGGPGNGNFVIGDFNVFGRVYMSTAGRGIAFGDQLDCAGEPGGTASIDACNRCSGGNTGIPVETDPSQCVITSHYDKLENLIRFYPNPFIDQLTLELKQPSTYSITDMTGKEMETGTGEGIVAVGNKLEKGLYILKVNTSNKELVVKIQKN